MCTVRVFDEAQHRTLERQVDVLQQLPPCWNQLVAALGRGTDALAVVSGRVDKREMRLPRRRYYGDSLSLAYQRALAVRGALLNGYLASPGARVDRAAMEARIIPVVGGAVNVGLQVENSPLADDRSVDVRVFAMSATATQAERRTTNDDDPRVIQLSSGDKLTLLTLIVALSAYLATVRLMAIARMSELKTDLARDIYGKPLGTYENDTAQRRVADIQRDLVFLTFGDAPMIGAGFLLGLHIFYGAGETALRLSIALFTIGGVVLMLLHAAAWVRTVAGKRFGRLLPRKRPSGASLPSTGRASTP
jgi:hypothetical protein